MNKNKKHLFIVKFEYVEGDNGTSKEFREDFYCTKKELENNIDLIERSAIRFGRKVYDININQK